MRRKKKTVEETPKEVKAPVVKVARRIEVTRPYRGTLSKERLIPAGIYDEGDAVLLGLENQLIIEDAAIWVIGE